MLFITLLLVAVIQGQHNQHSHSCIHTNRQQLTADKVVSNVITDMEKDGDGYIQPEELTKEFITYYDHDGSGLITEAEFTQQWHRTYHDAPDFAAYLFHNFDRNNDTYLTDADMKLLAPTMDTDGDKKVSIAEFKVFMLELYKKCTPPVK